MSHNLYPKVYVVQIIMSYKQIMSCKFFCVVEHMMSFKKLCRSTLYVAQGPKFGTYSDWGF